MLATGSRPIRIPQLPEGPGLVCLRRYEDACRIRVALRPGVRVAVVGAGFIGAEVAASLTTRQAHVTIIEAQRSPLSRVLSADLGLELFGMHEQHGFTTLLGTSVTGSRLEGSIAHLDLSDGSKL